MHQSHKLDTNLTLTKDGLSGHVCVKCGRSNTPPMIDGLDFECNVTDDEYEDVLHKRKHMKGRWFKEV
jgi:hypothetical protein